MPFRRVDQTQAEENPYFIPVCQYPVRVAIEDGEFGYNIYERVRLIAR